MGKKENFGIKQMARVKGKGEIPPKKVAAKIRLATATI